MHCAETDATYIFQETVRDVLNNDKPYWKKRLYGIFHF